MTQPYVGQVQPLGFGFAPKNWALCNGQILSIQQNAALFALLGTMYGGNGTTTFALPNLQSRVPMHVGTYQGVTYVQGEMSGVEQAWLNITNLPMHNHAFVGSSSNGNDSQPAESAALGQVATSAGLGSPYYAPDAAPQPLNPTSISITGGNATHPNIQPYQTINWSIAMYGAFPPRG